MRNKLDFTPLMMGLNEVVYGGVVELLRGCEEGDGMHACFVPPK